MGKSIISKEQAEQICKESFSIADFCRKVGWQPRGNNYRVVHKYIKEYNLDTSHFTGNKTNIGNKNNVGISDEQYYKKDKLIKGSELLKRLLKIREYKCEKCGISSWNGEHISLQIHHKDGDHFNNLLENLQILCPNCHSQTKNYSGKSNKKSNHVYIRERKHKCKNCGKPLHREPKTGLCIDCLRKKKQIKSTQNESSDVNAG